jgi:hypothetical protein
MKDLADELEELASNFNSWTDDEARENVKIFIERAIELRNRQQKMMKYYSPTKQRIVRLQLVDMDNQIAQLRQHFRLFEDECEKEKSKEAEVSELLEQGMETAEQIYIELKNNLPEKSEEFRQSVIEPMPPELKQEFYDRVAAREADTKEK